jgi:hypothetical protein
VNLGIRLKTESATTELRGKAQQLCADATDLARDGPSANGLAVLTRAATMAWRLE